MVVTEGRLGSASAELNAAEHQWWARFSGLEERFCWVQTPVIQRFLRGEYLRLIVEAAAGEKRVLELGCGSGWLAVLLARMGARKIVGTIAGTTGVRYERWDGVPACFERLRASSPDPEPRSYTVMPGAMCAPFGTMMIPPRT